MTLPNQGQPFGSVPFGGLSEFAGNNLDDWLLSLLGEVVTRALQLLNPAAAIQQFANEAGVPQLAELLRSALEALLFGSALDLVNSIVAAITGLVGGTIDDLARWASEVPLLGELVAALTGSGGGLQELTEWAANVPGIFQNFINGVLGGVFTVDDAISFFKSLAGFFPAVLDLADGTAINGVLSVFTDLADGTAEFIENGITSIIANADGTAMSVATLLNNFTGFLGTFEGLFSQTVSQTMLDSPPQQGFPLAFPASFGELVATPVELFTQNASRILSLDFTANPLVDAEFELIPLVTDIVERAILETGRVAELIDGVVPNLQAPPVIQEFIDYTINSFNTTVINETINNVVTNVFNTFTQVADAIIYTQATNLIQDLYQLAQEVVSGIHIF